MEQRVQAPCEDNAAQSAHGNLENLPMSGPDFSDVDSQAKAVELFKRGKLEKLFLLPPEFGGTEAPENVVYVPVGLAALKASTDNNVVGKLAEEGKVTRYRAVPKYAGKSFIPISIEITASDPGNFVFDLAVWGEGLKNAE